MTPAGYRPEIDGLRAVAIGSVVIFHFGSKIFSGGFVGVDVFFVISGFLITQIVHREAVAGEFSIVKFYERRLRRIAPALFLVLLVTFLVGLKVLFPSEVLVLAKSTLATIGFVSNVFFWQHSGYFDAAAESQPLLHTWSLAVEEQFYLFYPILVAALTRWRRRWLRGTLCLIAMASFAMSVWGVYWDPSATFYLPHARVWELLLGALVALWPATPMSRERREAISIIGIAAIGVSVFGFDRYTYFPGLAALLPAGGAALVIFASSSGVTLVSSALGTRPMVALGLISYSLYLWHWPVIVLSRLWPMPLDMLPPRASKGLLLVFCISAAWISWRFVESPFRNSRGFWTPRRIALFSAVGGSTFIATSVLAIALGGLPGRFDPQVLSVVSHAIADTTHFRLGKCFLGLDAHMEDFDKKSCLGIDSSTSRYLVIGDSHAAQLVTALQNSLTSAVILQANATGCMPLLGQMHSKSEVCSELMRAVFTTYMEELRPDVVVLVARWQEDAPERIGQTLEWLRSRRIRAVVVGPMVEYDQPLPRLLAVEKASGNETFARRHLRDLRGFDLALRSAVTSSGGTYLSVWDEMCGMGECLRQAAGVPMLFDQDHFSRAGAAWFIDRVQTRLVSPGPP